MTSFDNLENPLKTKKIPCIANDLSCGDEGMPSRYSASLVQRLRSAVVLMTVGAEPFGLGTMNHS